MGSLKSVPVVYISMKNKFAVFGKIRSLKFSSYDFAAATVHREFSELQKVPRGARCFHTHKNRFIRVFIFKFRVSLCSTPKVCDTDFPYTCSSRMTVRFQPPPPLSRPPLQYFIAIRAKSRAHKSRRTHVIYGRLKAALL